MNDTVKNYLFSEDYLYDYVHKKIAKWLSEIKKHIGYFESFLITKWIIVNIINIYQCTTLCEYILVIFFYYQSLLTYHQ